MRPLVLGALYASLSLAAPVNVDNKCTSDSFSFPELFGAELVLIEATETLNYTASIRLPGARGALGTNVTVSFCNVTVTYTHPGWNDTNHVNVWLPTEDWNGRLQGLGGGGYSASLGPENMVQPVHDGFVALDGDAGHPAGGAPPNAVSPEQWALTSTGNVNLYLVTNWAYRYLYDMTIIGKAVIEQFYGEAPQFSYFSGCSGGGRHAYEVAQRFPELYDGILGGAPALNIENFIPSAYWPQQVMNNLGYYPSPCEVNAFTQAAVEACDGLDGVEDGVISSPDDCYFRAQDAVGNTIDCNGTEVTLSAQAAEIVQAAWTGPRDASGSTGWFGISKDSALSIPTTGYATTVCADNGTCTADPAPLWANWIRYFAAKDPNYQLAQQTTEEYLSLLQLTDREFHSTTSASLTNLRAFGASGGKLLSWHGTADQAIPINGTNAYYQQVMQRDSTASEFYKYFPAPGVGHCAGGRGAAPSRAMEQLIAWVEQGIVPETLDAMTTNGTVRSLCPYPSKQTYNGGDPEDPASFSCEAGPEIAAGNLIADLYPFYRPS